MKHRYWTSVSRAMFAASLGLMGCTTVGTAADRTGEVIGDAARGAGDVAGDAVEGTGDAVRETSEATKDEIDDD